MSDNIKLPTLEELHRELSEAMLEHGFAEQEEHAARHKMTAAINRLNGAQGALDAAMETLRKSAPWNTDWHSKRNPGIPVSESQP